MRYLYFAFFINKLFLQIYKSNIYIKFIIDVVINIQTKIVFFFTPHDIEPNIDEWQSISSLQSKNNEIVKNEWLPETYKFKEKYIFNNYKEFIFKNKFAFDNNLITENNKFSNNDGLIIIKNNSQYVVKNVKFIGENDEFIFKNPINNRFFPEKSNIYFLTIQYFQENNKNPITLEIPKSMYLDKNELFTSIFVYRCLKYQNIPFYFDLNYKIKIIDNNINMIELDCNQYILLEKSNYKIISL